MEPDQHATIFREDYEPSLYAAKSIFLNVALHDEYALVTAKTEFIVRNSYLGTLPPLFLNGEFLQLCAVQYNETPLRDNEYVLSEKGLQISPKDKEFTLEITTRIEPDKNTALEGLYRSNGIYCTQCEAEGFRRITYSLDRPDVLSVFTTRIEGNTQQVPVLLSNGNLIEQGQMDENRQYAIWHDPFPKPTYLFALVAGQLTYIEDFFTTCSGREICLRIFVEPHNSTKCGHAMHSLKKAMKWDEEVYGLEYDLDIFMIVAVDDFNMGAMENKGLNVFNAKNIVVSPETATDADYLAVEAVVAHEYFHNWTGNRVTCRDWFQLSLKEGLTVYRDQEFSADMNSRAVQRITDVKNLRTFQFREDSGPMAHPIRPDSYVEINNFYTATVYNKGAEVVRMIASLIGKNGFRKGMDLYFARHDGQAVTCDDFIAAMADANTVDLRQFSRWYSQAGTPVLQVHEEYSETDQTYTLTVEQTCPPTPGQPDKKPFHVPIKIGLLDNQGNGIPCSGGKSTMLELKESKQTFSFNGFKKRPIVSFLREFSAPVSVNQFQSRDDLILLMGHDEDLFNRWQAATQLAEENILAGIGRHPNSDQFSIDSIYMNALRNNIIADSTDKALLALILQLPSEVYLAGKMKIIDPDGLHRVRQSMIKFLSTALHEEFLKLYRDNCEHGEHQNTSAAMAKRSLKNVALHYLMAVDTPTETSVSLCRKQYEHSTNMTDRLAAFTCITNSDMVDREHFIQDFYTHWQHDALVMDKWFSVQALSIRANTLQSVKGLINHPHFSLKNPNKVRALIGAFCTGNHKQFHDISGNGYKFLADHIIALNALNPQIAARLLSPFLTWKKYDEQRQGMITTQLEKILSVPCVSRDVYEIASKSLK